MSETRDIKQFYSTPEGYFENLSQRLSRIPVAESGMTLDVVQEETNVSLWTKLMPYVSLAAVFACAFIAGTILLHRTAGISNSPESDYEQMFYADLIPITYDMYQMEEFFMSEMDNDVYMTDDDFIEYMILTGTTIEQIEEYTDL